LLAAVLLAQSVVLAKPIEFDFVAPANEAAQNPYSRELWAEVTTPRGEKLTLPAFYADGGLYGVRARPDELGAYKFGAVSETTLGIRKTDLVVSLVTPAEVENTERTRLPSILVDPKDPRRFIRSDGLPYLPVGANLAWSPDDVTDRQAYYDRAFPAFAKANLNWMRIWMAHWDGLNLDWLPADMGPSPKPGYLSEDVAERWDKMLADAEENGVYVQMVLQYHGQYTTGPNSNWADNPWNAANPGGFLKTPDDFFTDANARVISLIKYRYIVARYGWSPAVVAWELFNEVHWTDAFRHGHEADVAKWHAEVADYIRAVDMYGHLITTSTDNLRSPIYAKMDYYQPHLYPVNLIAGARSFDPAPSELTKPVFYGETGDDHQPLADDAKKAGLNLVPPVWASIMGEGTMAAQPWLGSDILSQNRQNELGAVFRFQAINRVAMQGALSPFSAVVECKERMPLKVMAGQFWQRRAAPNFTFPVDGTDPVQEADIPAILAGSVAGKADGYPSKISLSLDLPKRSILVVHVFSVADDGAALTSLIDGKVEGSFSWKGTKGTPDPSAVRFVMPAGSHDLVIENPGPDWIGVSAIDLGIDESTLGLIGRRNDSFIEAWVWNRPNIFLKDTYPAVTGLVDLPDVPAGTWKVTWWDTHKGVPGESQVVTHKGGLLHLPTPPIERDAAFVLVRQG
jgi:hypothetical protein